MSTIEIFEPALCCSTGVCGPDVPQELVTFSADVEWLGRQGVQVVRYNLASEPGAFANKPNVLEFLQLSGSGGLPLTLVASAFAMAGRYPTRDELARWGQVAPVAVGRAPLAMAVPDAAGGCCGGGAGGC